MNPTIRKYSLLSVIFALLGLVLFWQVAAPPLEQAPRGPIEIGIGPSFDVTTNKTELIVNVPENSIEILVTFRFNKTQRYFIYVILPYTIFNATPYAIHNSMRYPNPEFNIGNFSSNFLNTEIGSSIVNATVDLNATFPFHFFGSDLKDELTLGVSIIVEESIIAVNYPWGAKQTILLTFFGDVSGVLTEEMYTFKKPYGQITIQKPFIVYLKIPSQTYLSESQPTPIEYYIKRGRRWIMFSIDFLEGRYAQTLFCSFANPTIQAWKEIFVFVGGVFVAISGSFFVQIAKNYVEKNEAGSNQKKEQGESEETQREETRDVKELIDLVDENVRITGFHVLTAYIPFTLILLIVLPVVFTIAFTLNYMSTAEINMMLVSLVALCVALGSLGTVLPSIIEDILIERYYKKIIHKEKLEFNKERILLKALVRMKIKQHEFSLSKLYSLKSSRSLFSEEKLLERLYE